MQPKLHDEYLSSVFKKLNKQRSQPRECPVRLKTAWCGGEWQVTAPGRYQVVQVVTTLLQRSTSYQRLRVEKTEQDSVGCIIKKQREEDKYLQGKMTAWKDGRKTKWTKKRYAEISETSFPHSRHDDPFRPDICHNRNSTQCSLWCLFKKHLLINLTWPILSWMFRVLTRLIACIPVSINVHYII